MRYGRVGGPEHTAAVFGPDNAAAVIRLLDVSPASQCSLKGEEVGPAHRLYLNRDVD